MDFTDGSSSPEAHADTDTSGGDARPHAARSVAEEAALLIDLLGARGWAGLGTPSTPPSGPPSGPPSTPGSGPRHDGATDHAADATDSTAGPCTCGGQQPAACRLCPVCQLIAFVQGISPDTIERMADVVDLAATALRDLATSRRAHQAPSPDGEDDQREPGDQSSS